MKISTDNIFLEGWLYFIMNQEDTPPSNLTSLEQETWSFGWKTAEETFYISTDNGLVWALRKHIKKGDFRIQ